jgi:hypothetical protein
MREAALAGDAARLAPYVDYAGMDARDKAAAPRYFSVPPDAAPADTPGGRGLREFLSRALARSLSAPPMGFADIAPWLSEIPIRPGGLGPAGPHGYRAYIDRVSFDRFEVRDEKASREFGSVLTFHRHGLSWRLEDVRFGQQ